MYCGGYSGSFWNTLRWSIRAACCCLRYNYTNANITSDNTIGGNDNGTLGIYKNVSGSGLERGFSWNDPSGLRSDDALDSFYFNRIRPSETFWKALSSGKTKSDGYGAAPNKLNKRIPSADCKFCRGDFYCKGSFGVKDAFDL